jgi:hypothetical protein
MDRAPGGMISGQRFDECSFKENADEVTFVFRATFEVVDRIGRLRQGFGGGGELIFNL